MKLRKVVWIASWIIGCGLLVFLSIPKYQLFQCRSTQSEAKAWLQHLYEAEKFYYAHHQEYASLEMLISAGLVKSDRIHYVYQTKQYDARHFQIIATYQNDIWSVDQTGEIKAIYDACKSR